MLINVVLSEDDATFYMNMLNRLSEEKQALLPQDPNKDDLLSPGISFPFGSEEYYLQWDVTNTRRLATSIWYALNPIPSIDEMHHMELHNLDAIDPMAGLETPDQDREIVKENTAIIDGLERDTDFWDEDGYQGEDFGEFDEF